MAMNPLQKYRQAQRDVREHFDPFTSQHCATCVTPCCSKPTWVRPSDIVLVEELGYPQPRRASNSPAGTLLDLLTTGQSDNDGAACDYLQPSGCAFPSDLRPFGCAVSICEPMRRLLPAAELAAVEQAVTELTRAHEALTVALLAPTPLKAPAR